MTKTDQVLAFYPKIYFACHTRHVSDPATGVTITSHQASVLDHLDDKVPIALRELASHMGVTPSTMSLTIDRLANLNYVKREKDREDTRRTRLFLTASGVKIKRSKTVLDPKLVKAMLSQLTGEEQGLALKGLELLSLAAERQMKSKSFEKAWAIQKDT